ncbi:MAG: DNA mismatch repair protein MutS, partial [Oscillospiraceae bacterium]|nr:DNA mismatch repair protein MutS [Oscillospiraceae bacterium]
IVRGGVDESYGIEVAKLAGLPAKILKRSKELLETLEDKNRQAEMNAKKSKSTDQISFDLMGESYALDMLRKTNIDELTDNELRELVSEVIKYI